MTKISFVIPVYNCKEHLPACLSAIRAIGAEDYEILLIDDGSTDGSGVLCDELAAHIPHIRVIHQPNGGVSAARNRGLQEAEGEYILFVDADDTLLPFDDSVYRLLDSGVDMLMYGMRFRYFHKGEFVKEENTAISHTMTGPVNLFADHFEDVFYRNYYSSSCNKIIRRQVLLGNNIAFDPRLTNYEDLAFSLYTASKCKTIAAVPQVYYLYNVDYDHDRTVDRIAKIEDLMGNTDLIAEAFVAFEAAAADGTKAEKQIRRCLVNIYFELFSVKMKTVHFSEIKGYCRDFKNDSYVNCCLCEEDLSKEQQRWRRWIHRENCAAIWLFIRYLRLRHWFARNLKRIIGKA